MKLLETLQAGLGLGTPLSVSFDSVKLLTVLQPEHEVPGIGRGSFAVMLKSTVGPLPAGPGHLMPQPAVWAAPVLCVLRLRSLVSWHEASQSLSAAARPAWAAAEDVDADQLAVLDYEVLGTLFEDAQSPQGWRFAGDVGHLLSPRHYGVYLPSPEVSDAVVNGGVRASHRIHLGQLRQSETDQYLQQPQPVYLSMLDIQGKRSAMFGKTRLGKSNVVKLLVQGMLDVTAETGSVGQLVFDVNGEYANDNPQDGASLASSYADRCRVYFLSQRSQGGSGKLLRFNLYERTEHAMDIMRELLPPHVAESDYVRTLLSCRLPALARDPLVSDELAVRLLRKLMLFWTILDDAGFEFDEERLSAILARLGFKTLFNPCFTHPLRLAAYQATGGLATPPTPKTFREMTTEMKVVAKFVLQFANDPNLMRNGEFLFDLDESIMARFLFPGTTEGTYVLRPCLPFHSSQADSFIDEILVSLDEGRTVIVDLGSANEQIIRYFAKTLSVAVFQAQEAKFVSNQLNNHYVQIYFEEAHMIFPPNSGHVINVYSRFAKEGAKFNIGIVYSTQSPSTVNEDLLAQTENLFIGHLSSVHEAQALSSVQFAFKGCEEDIMRARSPGYMRMLSYSHRYLIPIQANRYTGQSWRVPSPT